MIKNYRHDKECRMKPSTAMISFGDDEEIPNQVQELLVRIGVVKETKEPDHNIDPEEEAKLADVVKMLVSEIDTLIAVFPSEFTNDEKNHAIASAFSFSATQGGRKDIIVVRAPKVDLPLDYDAFPNVVVDDSGAWVKGLEDKLSTANSG